MILTDEEIRKIDPDGLVEGFARQVESAVIQKIKNQGAKAYLEGNPEGIWFVAYSENSKAPQIPLYQLPNREESES